MTALLCTTFYSGAAFIFQLGGSGSECNGVTTITNYSLMPHDINIFSISSISRYDKSSNIDKCLLTALDLCRLALTDIISMETSKLTTY